MVIRPARFNFILLAAMWFAACTGCQTTDKDKTQATLRVHLEVNPDRTGLNAAVPIYRASPILETVANSPILSEAYVEKADVVEAVGGFALSIQFDHSGMGLLEQYSAMNPGKHLAIFCQFGPKMENSRWLAAPVMGQRITDGMLIFTPDCTREEAEQIALGLNNVSGETKRRSKKK